MPRHDTFRLRSHGISLQLIVFDVTEPQIIKLPDNPSILPAIIEGIQDKKGKSITIVDLSAIDTAPSSSFVICEAGNPIQAAAVADSVQDTLLEKCGRKPSATDGFRNREWIILDYGEALVHIFLPEFRQRYALEELYADAPIRRVPDLD